MSRRTRRDLAVWVAAATSAVGASFAEMHPTGLAGLDRILQAIFGAGVVLIAARARRWTWVVLGAVPVLLSGGAVLVLSTFAFAGSIAAATIARRRDRVVGAWLAAVIVQTLLRADADIGVFALAALMLVAVLPASFSANRLLTPTAHRRVRWALFGVAATLAIAGVAGAWALRSAADDSRRAADLAADGLVALVNGDRDLAVNALTEASDHFAAAHRTTMAWWARPGLAIPALSQHLQAISDLADSGAAVADVGRRTAATVRLEDLVIDGGFDLAALAEIRPVAAEAQADLVRLARPPESFGSGWLLGSISDRLDEFMTDISEAADSARTIVDALELAPTALGEVRPQYYMVLIANPAESRELGGFLGSYGYIIADRGDLTFTGSVSTAALSDQLSAASVTLPSGLPDSYLLTRPARYAQNWTASPDYPTVVSVAESVVPQVGLPEPDGVLYVDPFTLARLLGHTSPARLGGGRVTVDAGGALEFLLRTQYSVIDAGQPERRELLGDLADHVFDSLFDRGALPSPSVLADDLGPLVESGHLRFIPLSFDDSGLTDRLGLTGDLDVTGSTVDERTRDEYLVTHGNARANKLDAYLHRAISVDIEIDSTGRVDTTVSVELTNGADPGSLDPYVLGTPAGDEELGTMVVNLNLYSAHDLVDATIQGRSVGARTDDVVGRRRHSVAVTIEPGESQRVSFQLRGVWARRPYVAALLPFPAAIEAPTTVTIGGGDGAMTATGTDAHLLTVRR